MIETTSKVHFVLTHLKNHPDLQDQNSQQYLQQAFTEFETIGEKFKPKTSCHGCKYDDSDVDKTERKKHCLPCLEPVTIRKNYHANS